MMCLLARSSPRHPLASCGDPCAFRASVACSTKLELTSFNNSAHRPNFFLPRSTLAISPSSRASSLVFYRFKLASMLQR